MFRIGVAVDGSDASRAALEWARREARVRDATIEVVTVARTEVYVALDVAAALGTDELRRAAEVVQASLTAHLDSDDAPVDTTVLVGHPAAELAAVSRRLDLLVVGTRGHGRIVGRMLGSVTHHLATHAHCPVVAVGGDVGDVQRVVVGVDGSEAAQVALKWALRAARLHHAVLEAVMTVRVGVLPASLMGIPRDPTVAEQARATAAAHLEQLVFRADDRGDAKVEQTVLDDRPDHGLLSRAEHAQLLVVGRRGLGGFAGLVLGSTSHRVLHHATCPVAVVGYD